MKKQNTRKIKEFIDLIVWQKAHQLVLKIYMISKMFPNSEKFGLTNQMRRASISITNNIAEGFGRQTYKEKVQFYYLSQGSLTELKNQLYIAKDIKYIKIDDFNYLMSICEIVHQLLQGLIKKSKTYIS